MADEERQRQERHLEHERARDRAGQRLAEAHVRVRQPAVDDEEKDEDPGERGAERDDVGDGRAVREPEVVP